MTHETQPASTPAPLWWSRPFRSVVVLVLHMYKVLISPLLPSACRFTPTCSEYMKEAVERHGVVRGVTMGFGRLTRCRPGPGGGGGYDPVPKALPKS